jgi:ribokinase
MDLVIRAPRFPEAGETILGEDFRSFPGGKGANQAVAAARLGCPVKMIGRVGRDTFGEQLRETVAQSGVDVSHVLMDSQSPTGVAFILLDSHGQNRILVAPGANRALSPQDISAVEAAFQGASVLLLQLECPLDTIGQAMNLARRHQVRIVLNPAPAQPLSDPLLEQVDVMVLNRSELATLTGMENAQEGVDHLRKRKVPNVIVTLGDEGVWVATGEREAGIPAHAVDVVDTTAAGDAFVGAFAANLTEGLTVFQAAEWGNAAGALAVTRHGAQPSLPSRHEVESLLMRSRARLP